MEDMCGKVSGCRVEPPTPHWMQVVSGYETGHVTAVNKFYSTHSTAVSARYASWLTPTSTRGTRPPLCTCNSSSAPCPRPTAPCGPPTVPINPAVAAVAATETSADRLSGCLRTSQALQEQPRCRTCAKHESIMRTDIRRATRYRHSRPASPSPPRPLQRKPEGPGGAQSTGTLRLAAGSI